MTDDRSRPLDGAVNQPAPVQSTQAGSDGRSIAMSVDPNVSNDVCTFCRHAAFGSTAEILDAPTCRLGFTPYFRSLSNVGPIWVSDCKSGEFHPTLLARDTAHTSTHQSAPVQTARVPKVRTSHHRNKEEAARLQALVAKRYAIDEDGETSEVTSTTLKTGGQ